ncbi:MAG: hypothetical protein Q8P67_02265, partial [archaeon]|nr:hypothetical protein [archaeon]
AVSATLPRTPAAAAAVFVRRSLAVDASAAALDASNLCVVVDFSLFVYKAVFFLISIVYVFFLDTFCF